MSDQLSEIRRLGAARGLYEFSEIYFPHRHPEFSEPIAAWKTSPGGIHIPNLCKRVDKSIYPGSKLATVYPREHAKTVYGTTVQGCRQACYSGQECIYRKNNLVLVGANQDEASRKMRNIVMELESNPIIRRDFGDSILPATGWRQQAIARNAKEIVLSNGFRMAAVPIGAKIRGANVGGFRIHQIVLDDPEDDEMVMSATTMAKLRRWVTKALIPALDKDLGSIGWFGTVVGPDALLKWIIDDGTLWDREMLPAIDPVTWHAGTPDASTLLWPEAWTVPKLQEREEEIGTVAFNQEYLHIVIDPEQQIFRPEWWRYYDRNEIKFEQGLWYLPDIDSPGAELRPMTIYMGVDPAVGDDKTIGAKVRQQDYFALVVLGRQQYTNKLFVLDIVNKRCTFKDQQETILQYAQKWRPACIGIEAVLFQQWLIQAMSETSNLPFQPIRHRAAKDARLRAMSRPVESGRVFLQRDRPEVAAFVKQASNFPLGAKDDMLDATCMAIDIATYGGSEGFSRGKRKLRGDRLYTGY